VNWFIHQAMNNQPLTIYGDGSQRRDYIHIDDVVRALLPAGLDDHADGQVLNVGSGVGVSFLQMAGLIVNCVGRGELRHVDWPADAALVETGGFIADTSRIQSCLGWKASIPLATGIQDMVASYAQLNW